MYGGYLAKTPCRRGRSGDGRAMYSVLDPRQKPATVDGRQSRARVHATYNWKHIIPVYEKFWAEMAAERGRDHAGRAKTNWLRCRRRARPFSMYAAYPTAAFKKRIKSASRRPPIKSSFCEA